MAGHPAVGAGKVLTPQAESRGPPDPAAPGPPMMIPFPAPNPYTVLGTRRWAEWLLGALHPGGERLTRLLVERAGIAPGARVLGVGCGNGAVASVLGDRVRLVGIDPARHGLRHAAASRRGVFLQATGGRLPFRDGTVDAVLAEAALPLAGGFRTAFGEARRALRPGGVVAFTDFVRETDAPWEGAEWAHMALVERAPSEAALRRLVAAAGFRLSSFSDESWSLTDLEESVQARLNVLGLVSVLASAQPRSEWASLDRFIQQARRERDEGLLRYVLVVAHKADGGRAGASLRPAP